MTEQEKIGELERFLIDNQQLDQLETELSGFNIFEAVGAIRQELRHSDFLSFILNPNASHGLGDEILSRILIDIVTKNDFEGIRPIDINLATLDNTEIRREWRNIDLLIIIHELRLVVAIENKVDSGESKNQLKTYSKILKETFSKDYKIKKVFLTPDGISPTYDDSWGVYSYQGIATQIEHYLKKKSEELAPKINQTLTDYLTLLRRHVVPNEKLVELCRKIYREHRTALDLIFEHKMDIYSEIRSHLTDIIKSDPDVVLDDSNKSMIRFRAASWEKINELDKGNGWTSTGKILLYEIQNLGDSLRLKLIIGPGDNDVRDTLHQIYLENAKDFRKGKAKLSDKWTQIMRLDILSKSAYEDPDIEDMKAKIDKFWMEFKKRQFSMANELIGRQF